MITREQIEKTTAEWEAQNPTLAADVIGIEVMATGYLRYKRGNGADAWLVLPYLDKIPFDVEEINTTVSRVENIEKDYVSDEVLSGILSEYVTDDDIDAVRLSLETKIDQNAEAIALRATKEYVAESLNGYVTEAELSAELKVSANGILSTVSQSYATTDAVNTAQNTANAAGAAAAIAQNTADSAKNTADAVGDNLSNNYYAKSTIDQKFDSITLSVINPDGEETSIKLSDGKLDMKGLVTFTDLSTQGKTTINGSNITTGIINADLITAGTIKGIEYISRSASQPNDYLQIWNSGLTTRKIGSSNGYATYTDIFLSPGKLSCQYGDINQANYITDYGYDGIRLRAGDDASSETAMSIIASRSNNVSRLTVTSPNVDFTGSVNLPNGHWLTAKNSAGSTRNMVMLNSSDQYFFGYSGFTESEGASFFDGNIVYLRSNEAIYFTAYAGKGNGQILIGAQTSVSDRGLELKPATNNTCSLGWEDGRWKYAYIWKIYTTNSVSVDSDKRLKKDISYDLSALDRVIDNLNPAVYRMRDDEEEKLRFGFIAQDVQQAFMDAGLNPDNYAFITKSKTEDGEMLSLGYTETNALLWHRQQQLEQRIAELEKRIA